MSINNPLKKIALPMSLKRIWLRVSFWSSVIFEILLIYQCDLLLDHYNTARIQRKKIEWFSIYLAVISYQNSLQGLEAEFDKLKINPINEPHYSDIPVELRRDMW